MRITLSFFQLFFTSHFILRLKYFFTNNKPTIAKTSSVNAISVNTDKFTGACALRTSNRFAQAFNRRACAGIPDSSTGMYVVGFTIRLMAVSLMWSGGENMLKTR